MPPDRWLALTVRLSPDAQPVEPFPDRPGEVPGEVDVPSGTPGPWLPEEPSQEAISELSRDLIPQILMELGGRGVEEKEGSFTTYLPPPKDLDGFLREARSRVRGVASPGTELLWAWQPQEDWESLWRRDLGPRRITDRLLVAPTWDIPQVGAGEILIVLDPGMAFGTAEHATTRGCLRLMDSRVRDGDHIADIGSGSAILSIAAAHLGARGVLAVEADPMACEAALENVAANGVTDRVRILAEEVGGTDPLPEAPFHGIVANIQRVILLRLLPAFRESLVEGGWVILSGILTEERDEVLAAAADCGLLLDEEDQEEEWWSGGFRLSSSSR